VPTATEEAVKRGEEQERIMIIINLGKRKQFLNLQKGFVAFSFSS